jgi:hypothetical protein
MPPSPVKVKRSFGGTYYLRLHGRTSTAHACIILFLLFDAECRLAFTGLQDVAHQRAEHITSPFYLIIVICLINEVSNTSVYAKKRCMIG